MAFTARPLLRAAARPLRGLQQQQQPRHAQLALFSSTRTQQQLPGGTPGETSDPSEQKTPLGPYYESMLIDPQPIPKTKPEQPPASSPKAPASKAPKAEADPTPKKKTTTEAGGLPTDPDPVPAPSSPTQPPPLSATASPDAAAAASASVTSSTPSFSPSSSSPITFGTKLGGPANEGTRAERLKALRLSQGTLIAGIRVPPRPDEPDNCCMSGCVNCVWDRYRDDMEEWAAISVRAEAALQAQRRQGSPEELGKVSAVKGMPSVRRAGGPELAAAAATAEAVSMDDDGGGSDTNWVDPLATAKTAAGGDAKIAKDFWDDELYKNVPVGIKEFMKQEKRLKEKHMREKDPAAI